MKPKIERVQAKTASRSSARFPALNIFVGDLLIARANGFDCEFVQHAKNLRGDPIRGASKSAQALSREG